MNKPKCCISDLCECIMNKHDTFCIGKIPENVTMVEGKEHRNDMILCIFSPVSGTHSFAVNAEDMGLLAQVAIAGMKTATQSFSVWYLFNQKMQYSAGKLMTLAYRHCCDVCGTEPAYETEAGWLCAKCEREYMESLQEERENDPAYYCISCGRYSDILEHGKCPMCFEMGGYT